MTLTFYMKGGHKFRTHWVKSWKITHSGGAINGLTIEYYPLSRFLFGEKLIVGSIILADVQAITRS